MHPWNKSACFEILWHRDLLVLIVPEATRLLPDRVELTAKCWRIFSFLLKARPVFWHFSLEQSFTVVCKVSTSPAVNTLQKALQLRRAAEIYGQPRSSLVVEAAGSKRSAQGDRSETSAVHILVARQR